MREILFRGKKWKTSVFDETDWVYGALIDSGNHEQVAIYPWVNGASTMSVRQLVYARMEAVKPETVGQYTGLIDKNGVKIFEGDILRYTGLKYTDDIDDLCYVVYDNAEFALKFIYMSGGDCDSVDYAPLQRGLFDLCEGHNSFTVVGNIHDNPELLEVEC